MTDVELIEALREAVTIEPCHVTGTHDPTHTPRYTCTTQKALAFDRVLAVLNLKRPPRKLHGPGCPFCHGSSGEKELKHWAAGYNQAITTRR